MDNGLSLIHPRTERISTIVILTHNHLRLAITAQIGAVSEMEDVVVLFNNLLIKIMIVLNFSCRFQREIHGWNNGEVLGFYPRQSARLGK